MLAAALLTLIYLVMAFLQPFMPEIFGYQKWLIGMAPILLAYAALRSGGLPLALFILIGGVVHDLLLLHYIGFGPLLWACTIYVIASQKPWLRDGGAVVSVLVGFTASFLYNSLDRILYLLYHGFWSWDLDLSYALLTLAAINAGLSPLLFFVFDAISQKTKQVKPKPSRGYLFG
ncbi:MAG: hypothetical protein AAF571_09570 [Verrucomicrobiota bacterium]